MQQYISIQTVPYFPQGVITFSSGKSEFYAQVKGTSAGLGAVSMLKDLGVGISKNTQIEDQCLKCELMRPQEETLQYGEELGEFCTLPLQHCGYKSSHRVASRSARNHEPHPGVVTFDDAGELNTHSEKEMEFGQY